MASSGSVTDQSVQTELKGKPLRLFLIGYELGRPGGPRKLSAGREIMRSHYEMIVERSAGLALGQEVPLGTRMPIIGIPACCACAASGHQPPRRQAAQ